MSPARSIAFLARCTVHKSHRAACATRRLLQAGSAGARTIAPGLRDERGMATLSPLVAGNQAAAPVPRPLEA
jgi:hypothetical protein